MGSGTLFVGFIKSTDYLLTDHQPTDQRPLMHRPAESPTTDPPTHRIKIHKPSGKILS